MNAILSDAFEVENINKGIASGFSEMILKTEAEIERKVEETAKEIIAMDSIEYTYTVRGLASGEIMMESPEATESENGEEEPAEPLEDLLEDEQ